MEVQREPRKLPWKVLVSIHSDRFPFDTGLACFGWAAEKIVDFIVGETTRGSQRS